MTDASSPRLDRASRALKVWLVTIGEPLPIQDGSRALRCRILARELVRRGHDVTWVTSDFDHFSKTRHTVNNPEETEKVEGYSMLYLHGCPYSSNISFARHRNHQQIARDFEEKAESREPPDVVVCSFPPIELAQSVIAYAKRHQVASILDVRDLWPDELVARFPKILRGPAALASTGLRMGVSRAASEATAVTGVSFAYRDWGLARARRSEGPLDQVIPLGYPDSAASAAIRATRSEARKGPCRLLFSGSFNLSVDVGLLIQALRRMPDLELTVKLCGTGQMEADWRAAAKGDERIEFTGWLSADQIRRIAAESTAGIACYRPNSLVALPNKFFEYLSFGLPVINSIPGEAAELVAQNGVGWNYRAGSIDSLADALRSCVAASKAGSLPYGSASDLYEKRFASHAVYGRFADLVECVAEEV